MGIDLLIKVLGYEVVFWGSVLAVSFVTQGNVDVFRYFPLYLTISLLLIILPYWRQHNQRHHRQQNKEACATSLVAGLSRSQRRFCMV